MGTGKKIMHKISRLPGIFVLIVLAGMISSCSSFSARPGVPRLAATAVEADKTLLRRYAPVFIIENPETSYNRIGTPSAGTAQNEKEIIYVDPDKASVYTGMRSFKSFKGTYTNLIYRIHFEKIPGGLSPFYLGTGKNTGLIVIITLDTRNRPILYTTVHTCGCYLAFVPTSYMPESGFPGGWEKGRQDVHGENLPGLIKYNSASPDREKTFILLRDGSHRVKDMWIADKAALDQYDRVTAGLQPLLALEALPLEKNRTTSFYEESGPRKDYVKGSHKTRERILMSWWTFDWRVGEDKKYGKDKTDGILFYTSLKPWDRQKSDMRDFAAFLMYWKWNL